MAKAKAKKSVPKKSKVVSKAKPQKKSTKPAVKASAKKPGKVVVPKVHKKTPKASEMVSLQGVISPLADRVLVQALPVETRTPGGLYLPDSASSSGQIEAQVIAVGPGARTKSGRLQPLDVKIGDKVMMAEYSGDEVQIMGVKAKLVKESEILGIIDSE